jgi:hypothetical protein
LVVSALTCTNCTPCGFCTAAAGGERRKLDTVSRSRKAAALAFDSPAVESLAVENRDKGILQKEKSVSDCGVGVTRAASYVRPRALLLTGHGRTGDLLHALRESSRSLQTIALGETVGNVTGVTRGRLAASKTMRSRGIWHFRRMASGLHNKATGEEMRPSSQ